MIFPQIFRFGSLHFISLAGEFGQQSKLARARRFFFIQVRFVSCSSEIEFGQQSNLARAMILLLFSTREKRSKKASVFHSLLWVALLPASRVGGAWFSGLRPALPMVGEPAAAPRRRPRRIVLI